jgi:putative membrane protein
MVLRWALIIASTATIWAVLVFFLYAHLGMTFLRIPFLPISTIGTAVAFYVGFKNNAAYNRFWEGRKIWGGVVNASRTWATAVLTYVDVGEDTARAGETRRQLIYRQLAWINALRLQLRKTSRFHHKPARTTKRRLSEHADHMRNDWDTELQPFLTAAELAEVSQKTNSAAHLLAAQAGTLRALLAEERIDLFHQIELMHLVETMYGLQGKCERIKNTPFPRFYAEYSRVFTRVFLFLVPLGLLDVFADHIHEAATLQETWAPIVPMILASGLISWVFFTMEGVGDSSEDPFERSMNDVPMNALCRGIEIDLREMLGETEVPAPERSADGILY